MSDSGGPDQHLLLFATSPRVVLLVGELGEDEILELVGYCVRLHASGRAELHLDLDGVTDCDRAGLEGLRLLGTRVAGLAVTVRGARWGQFMAMLSREPVAEVATLCDTVRELVGAAPGRRAERPGRRPPPSPTGDTVVWRREDVTGEEPRCSTSGTANHSP